MSHFDLTGQVIVITGGASGIGLACAERFQQAGAVPVLVDRDADALAAAARHSKASRGSCAMSRRLMT